MTRSVQGILATAAAALLIATSTALPATAVVGQPGNDAFAAAAAADPLPFYQTLDTSAATTETVDAEAAGLCGLGGVSATVWYTLTAPETRAYQVDVTNSSYAAGIVVVTGAPGSLALIACRPASLGFDADAGTTYRILVYGSGSGGSLHLAVGFAPPWTNDQAQDRVDTMVGIQPTSFTLLQRGAAQTVTAGITGRLMVVVLPLARLQTTTKSLSIEIRDGGPSGTTLATSDPVEASEIPVGAIDGPPIEGGWIPFWFADPATITAGETFAIVMPPADTAPTVDPAWGWGKARDDPYGHGNAFEASTTSGWNVYLGEDFAFDTWVEPLGWPRAVRYWGPTRFGTAVDISYNTFEPGVDVAYVAYAFDFPDALAGAAAAGTVTGPVLLVRKDLPLDADTKDELQGLKPKKIVVLGSAGVVSDAVLNALKPYAGSGGVVRYAGPTRFETAAAVSKNTFGPGVAVAYIAYAFNFPDALAGAAAAGTVKGPVLLAATTGPLNAATAAELTRLKPQRIVVLGSAGVISDAVLNTLKPYAGSGGVVRYAGPTRFETAASISSHTFSPGVPVAYIAYAFNFPDALAGAAAAGTVPGPVLLVATTGPLNAATAAELTRLKPHRIVVLGSTGVVSDAVLGALKAYATGP